MSTPIRRPGLPRAPKALGEVGEARLMAKILSLGFAVAKPFGDSVPFDFIVAVDGKLWKVQVKSAWTMRDSHSYRFAIRSGRRPNTRPYTVHDADFIAAYVGPADAWFVIPIEQVLHRQVLILTLASRSKYAKYREAWHLLCPSQSPPQGSRSDTNNAGEGTSPMSLTECQSEPEGGTADRPSAAAKVEFKE